MLKASFNNTFQPKVVRKLKKLNPQQLLANPWGEAANIAKFMARPLADHADMLLSHVNLGIQTLFAIFLLLYCRRIQYSKLIVLMLQSRHRLLLVHGLTTQVSQ
jgi:hypothetical protein